MTTATAGFRRSGRWFPPADGQRADELGVDAGRRERRLQLRPAQEGVGEAADDQEGPRRDSQTCTYFHDLTP